MLQMQIDITAAEVSIFRGTSEVISHMDKTMLTFESVAGDKLSQFRLVA